MTESLRKGGGGKMRPEPSVTSGPLPERTRETHYGRTVLTYARRPRHFNEVLRRSVETFPEKTALVFEGQRWSYRHLWEEACSLAAVLQEDYAFGVGER